MEIQYHNVSVWRVSNIREILTLDYAISIHVSILCAVTVLLTFNSGCTIFISWYYFLYLQDLTIAFSQYLRCVRPFVILLSNSNMKFKLIIFHYNLYKSTSNSLQDNMVQYVPSSSSKIGMNFYYSRKNLTICRLPWWTVWWNKCYWLH